MARKKGWPQDLAERCQEVGWAVAYGKSGHYKATRPDGQILSWPSTPSGTNSEKNVLAKARRLGLDEAEETMRQRQEAQRLQKIQEDRNLNGVPEHKMKTDETNPPSAPEANLGWVEVNGTRLAIAEIAVPVRHQHYRGGEPRDLPQSEELLLVDGSVRYRCRKPTGAWVGDGPVLCDRHFETPGGLVVHWARGAHADDVPEPRAAAPRRVDPEPEPKPLAVAEPGLMARMEDLGQEMLDIRFEAQRLANHSQDVHQRLQDLAQEISQNLASPEMREKAAKFDRMIRVAESAGS